MADDIQSNIRIDIDAQSALATLKNLQRQISAFHTSLIRGSADAASASAQYQQKLINAINRTGQFSAEISRVSSSAEAFTTALEKNKLSLGEYFRYAGGASKTFGKLFSSEFKTIEKTAIERVKTLQTQYINLGRDASGALKTIKVRPLALDMDNLSTKMQIAAQKTQILNKLMMQGSTNLLNFGKNTQWAGRQLMVGFTVPLTMLGSVASKTFMEMEQAVIKFKRVYGDATTSMGDTDKMVAQLQNLASEFTKYGVAVSDTMNLAAEAAAMGKTGADLLAQVGQAAKLSTLGSIEQSKALETTMSITNAFGVATEQLAGKIDFLNAVENQTVTSIDDLTTAIPKAGPVIKQLGGNVEDLAFFLTAMKEGGINASEGANALKSGLASMINPTKQATEFMSKFGISINGIVEGNKGNVKGMVIGLAQALNQLDPLNRARAIEQMFGKFQFARISTLLQNVTKDGSQASRVLELTKNTAAELAVLSQRELNRMESSPMYKFQKAVEDLKKSLVPLGEAFVKAITPIVNFAKGILDKFNALDEGGKTLVTNLVGIIGVVGPAFLMGFGLIANGVANVIKLFTGLKMAFNRATGTTQELGVQTDYMTQMELEAAAAAASLEQAHSNLTQTFSVEAAALEALTAAYQKAVTAQDAFQGNSPQLFGGTIKGGKKKGYASGGIIQGPGTGTSDSIAALVSNGEAIIPAKSVAKYPKLINALISGNIPGFSKGKKGKGPNTDLETLSVDELWATSQASHASPVFAQDSEQFKKVEIAMGALPPEYKQFMSAVSNLVADLPSALNQAMKVIDPEKAGEAGVRSDKFLEVYNARAGKFSIAGKLGGLDPNNPEDVKALQEVEDQIGIKTKQLADQNNKGKVTDIELQKATRQVIDELKKKKTAIGRAAQALDNASQQVGQGRIYMPTEDVNSGLASGKLKKVRKPGRRDEGVFATGVDGREIQVASITSAESSSPNTVRPADPKNFPKGYRQVVQRRNKQMQAEFLAALSDEEKVSYAGLPSATKTRIRKAVAKGTATLSEALAAEIQNATEQGYNKATQRNSPPKKLVQAGKDSGEAIVAGARSQIDEAAAAGQQLGNAAATGSATGAAGATVIANSSDIAKKDNEEKKKGISVSKKLMGNLSKAGMALSAVSAGVSMIPGEIGQTAQQLLMPLMSLSAVLPMLASKAGLATVAIGAFVAAIVWNNMAMDAARKKGFELAESLGAGEKNIRSLAEFAGKVSAGEAMDQLRKDRFSQWEIKAGKKTFGESFVESDAGKAMTNSVKNVISQGGGRAQAQSQLLSQLTTAVASGAVSTAEARSIAANVAEQLGDYSFGIQVNAKITELMGPNGENLEKDPLKVRVAIVQETRKSLQAMNTRNKATYAATPTDVGLATGGTILGAAGGMAAGSILGGMAATGIGATVAAVSGGAITAAAAGSVVPVVGTIAGLVVGAIGGAIVGSIQRNERIAKAAGATVAMSQMALQQQQEMLDSLDLDYQKRIDSARATGDIAKAEELITQHIKDRSVLMEEQGKLIQQIADGYEQADAGLNIPFWGLGGMREQLNTAADEAIKNKYKDDPIAQALATQAGASVKDANLSDKMDYTVRVAIATGDIDPGLAAQFFTLFGQNKGMMDASTNLIANMGTKFFGESMQAMNMFVDKDGKPIEQHQTAFMMKLSTMETEDAQNLVNLMSDAAKAGGKVPLDVIATVYSTNADAQKELQTLVNELDMINGKDISINVAAKIMGAEDFAVLKADQEYFDKLPPIQKRIYVQTMETLLNLSGDQTMIDLWHSWAAANPGDKKETFMDYVTFLTHQKTETADTTQYQSTTTGGSTGGGGPTASPIDDYLKKLRDLRQAQVSVTTGFAASMKEIEKWFGGNKTIKVYDGLKSQMRNLGLDEGLLETLIGMDPKEFEKEKKKLFTFNSKGMITGLTKAGKELKEVSDSVTMGAWDDKMKSQTKLTQDQQVAFSRLTKSGMSVADAYETIQDAAMAQALASKNVTDADIAAKVKQHNIMKDNLRLMEAMTALEKKNSAIKDTTKLLRATDKAKDFGFTPEDMQKILADDTMREAYTAMIQPNVKPEDAKRMQKVIEDALKMANLNAANDLILKYKSGLSGLSDIFSEGFDKAMESFNVKEKNLQIKADIQMKPFNDAIEAAQDSIAALQYQIDDYDAGLTRIADQEELINKAYDDKLEALDKVQKANDTIARQQKNQLSLADALASGDIAAAARAAQEIRQQDAQDALDRQRDTLEKARKAELESQTAKVMVNGQETTMTRKQIEDAKKGLEKQVFNIEETSLEPAQEAVRQIQAKLREDIQSITVQGKTKMQWEELGNKVDMARVNSEKFADAIANATTVVDELVAAWGKEKGMTIAEAQAIISGTSLEEVAGEFVAAVKETQTNTTAASSNKGNSSTNNQGNNTQNNLPDKPPVIPDVVDKEAGLAAIDKAVSGQTIRSIGEAGSGAVTMAKAKALAEQWRTTENSLENFKFGGKNYGNRAGGADSGQGMTPEAYVAWKTLYDRRSALDKQLSQYNIESTGGKSRSLKIRGGAFIFAGGSNSPDAKFGVTAADFNASDSAAYKSDVAAAIAKLPEQWTWLKGYRSRFNSDYENYRGPKDALYKARDDENMESYTLSQIIGNPTMKAALVKRLEKNGSKDGLALINRYQSGWNKIKTNMALANKYRAELRNAGYTDGILKYASSDYANIMQDTSMMLGAGFVFSPDKFKEKVGHYATGGMVLPNGYASGTDTIPAMLTPGEFVVKKFAVDSFGTDRLEAINAGIDPTTAGASNTAIIGGDSLYNYNVSVNVRSDADPNAIARTVMEQIRRVDSQRIRSTRV